MTHQILLHIINRKSNYQIGVAVLLMCEMFQSS